MACENNGPLGQSAGRPPSLIARHIKTYAQSEIDGGMVVRGEFGHLEQRLPDGRFGHLVGFEVFAECDEIVINATTLAAAVPGHEQYGLIQNIQLRAGGHEYFGPNLDGRHLRLDYFKRNGVLCIADPADIPDSADADLELTFRLRYLFGGHGSQKGLLDNAIPLAMLNHKEDPDDILRFTLGTAFRGNAGITGVTMPSAAALYDSVALIALVAYTEDPVLDAAWHLREDRTGENEIRVDRVWNDRPTVMEYMTLHSFVEDGGNADLATEYAGTHTIRHGDYLYADAKTSTELHMMQQFLVETDRIGDRATKSNAVADGIGANTAAAISSVGTPAQIDIVATRPDSNRSDMAVPPIYHRHSTDPAAITSSRYLYRQVFPHSDAWRRRALCRVGREGAVGVLPGPTIDIEKALLPNRVVTPQTAVALARNVEK